MSRDGEAGHGQDVPVGRVAPVVLQLSIHVGVSRRARDPRFKSAASNLSTSGSGLSR